MLESYKSRKVRVGQRVMVYFNLHSKKFSVKDAKTGLVLAHGDGIMLENVTFSVQQKGRERVLKEQRKNVHAFVIGEFAGVAEKEGLHAPMKTAYYNPYQQDCFTDKETGEKLTESKVAFLKNKQVKYL